MVTKRTPLFLALLAMITTKAQAQEEPALRPGAQVRFWLVDDGVREDVAASCYVGRLVALTGDVLEVRIHQRLAPLSIPIRLLDRLEVSAGRESRLQAAWRASRVVVIVGLIVGAAIGQEVANATNRTGSSALGTMASRAAIYGATTGATAAIWGALHPGERWVRVSPSFQPGTAAGHGGFGVRLAISL